MSAARLLLHRRSSSCLQSQSRLFSASSPLLAGLVSAYVVSPAPPLAGFSLPASLPSSSSRLSLSPATAAAGASRRTLSGRPHAAQRRWTAEASAPETAAATAHAAEEGGQSEERREEWRRRRRGPEGLGGRRLFSSCVSADFEDRRRPERLCSASSEGDGESNARSSAAGDGASGAQRPFRWSLLPVGAVLGVALGASPTAEDRAPPSRWLPRLGFASPALARCCGIVGYLGDKEAEPVLMEGLELLQNRGYDSCGITSISAAGELVTTKFASKGSTCDSIDILRREGKLRHAGNCVGIAHTRWATHGGKTDENAHPHHDWKDRISLVHNGTIDNYALLKKALIERGCTFRSETDTEVIANLIGWYLDQVAEDLGDASTEAPESSAASASERFAPAAGALALLDPSLGAEATLALSSASRTPSGESRPRRTLSFEEAVKRAVGELQGTWGLCIVHRDYPDRLILARNGSPLLVGSAGGQVFVASEPAALARHTNQYLMLKDGEIAVVTAQGVGQLEATRPVHRIAQEEKIEVSPEPFPHWTVKEVFEQPQALARAMNYGGRIAPYQNRVKLGGLDQNRQALLAIKNLLICGCGTSLYAGMYGELLMQWLKCFDQVRAVDASEIDLYHFPKADAGVLLLSQSGETLDTVRACQLADVQGLKKFSVVNQVGSLLARMTNCGVYLNAGREVAVASTKAFSSQVAVLSLIAAWFAQNQCVQTFPDRCTALMDAIHRLPVYAGMTLNCRAVCRELAAGLKDAKTLFVLGRGFGYPVALEGALKIKEVAYLHAEGFPAGALKHGPFALIDEAERTPVILLIFADQHAASLLNAAQQVKARGARLICITDEPDIVRDVADAVLVVPSNGPLTALLACIPLQLLAYELAVAKGLNPDKPRGLAKTVTVM
ncbi:glucosamine-fructose-6-phosphate aminotransferase [Besnoitia besnoiti]|uniref:glutamine--fructose-6-phosphate transaminase (isomerizing) n=1 Tax=Besnoitia besnoiti TaxID=94643 RepID=A0A2A9MQR3_BESBE|nr:glucosamine-fructose-6-phosphate aminotransferase [Besnoitia besnoiti]PFH38657.1 glucosamine-fructose-6-phosphate aminotransferase [Besnoitia besnoiti]